MRAQITASVITHQSLDCDMSSSVQGILLASVCMHDDLGIILPAGGQGHMEQWQPRA